MRRAIACGLALVVASCSGPPKKVGGQPSWRKPVAVDPVPLPPHGPKPTLTIAPRTAAVQAYNDGVAVPAPSSPVGDAIAAEIRALAPPGASPIADGRMYAAATALAAVVPAEGILPYPLVEFALQHHGIIEPSPNMLVIWGPLDRPQLLVDNMRDRLAEFLHAEPQRRFGVGTAPRGDRAAIVVMMQASNITTDPIPRSLPLGGRAPLVGQVGPGFAEPEAFVTGGDGAVKRIALATKPDGSFAGTVTCGPTITTVQVEVAAADHTGTTVLANIPIWCGQAPPTTASASVDPEDAAPVTSAAAAEARLLALLNRDRAAAGLPALIGDPATAAVARAHSEDMHAHGFVGHLSPTTGSAADRVAAAGIRTGVVLENIARAYGPVEAQAGLMNSPGHRANALSTAATHVGIGVVLGDAVSDRREMFITEVFTRVPPPLDPVAAHRTVMARFIDQRSLQADPDLDSIAQAFVAELARGVPRSEAKQIVSRRLAALGTHYQQATSVVVAVGSLDEIDPAVLIGDTASNRIGLALAQGDHPELGPGAYWLVVILAIRR